MKGSMTLGILIALVLGIIPAYGEKLVQRESSLAKAPLPWEESLERRVPETTGLINLGEQIFRVACLYCHGKRGEGDGRAVRYLFTKPRDFTSGKFKVRTTPSGSLPTDEDLFRTITHGFPEYRMPPFRYLTAKERWALVYYIKTLSPPFKERDPDKPIDIGKEPPVTADLISQGETLYNEAECWKCHGKEGRGDGPSAPELKDDWDNPMRLLDFRQGDQLFRRGARARDIIRTILTGMMGTPMPSYADALTTEQAWALAVYIEHITKKGEER